MNAMPGKEVVLPDPVKLGRLLAAMEKREPSKPLTRRFLEERGAEIERAKLAGLSWDEATRDLLKVGSKESVASLRKIASRMGLQFPKAKPGRKRRSNAHPVPLSLRDLILALAPDFMLARALGWSLSDMRADLGRLGVRVSQKAILQAMTEMPIDPTLSDRLRSGSFIPSPPTPESQRRIPVMFTADRCVSVLAPLLSELRLASGASWIEVTEWLAIIGVRISHRTVGNIMWKWRSGAVSLNGEESAT